MDGNADAAWREVDGRPGRALRECLVAATAAPSVHNTQPWLFRLRGARIDVLADRSRQLVTQDPDGRELLVSVGAALFNLRVAVRARGHRARARLMPDPRDPDLAASIATEPAGPSRAAVATLAEAIPRRHTNRRPFADTPVPAATLGELSAAAAAEGTVLLVLDQPLRDGVLSLTRTAENTMLAKPSYRAELSNWTTPGGVGRRDGVPREALGPRDETGALPLRDFAVGHGTPTATVAFEPDPTLILLFTKGDLPLDWLRAGAALERVLLTATLHGLAATPLSQLLAVPRLRDLLGDAATGQVVQTVLRVGYPTTQVRATPRRAIEEVIVGGAGGTRA